MARCFRLECCARSRTATLVSFPLRRDGPWGGMDHRGKIQEQDVWRKVLNILRLLLIRSVENSVRTSPNHTGTSLSMLNGYLPPPPSGARHRGAPCSSARPRPFPLRRPVQDLRPLGSVVCLRDPAALESDGWWGRRSCGGGPASSAAA